jgi:hypothetical protein
MMISGPIPSNTVLLVGGKVRMLRNKGFCALQALARRDALSCLLNKSAVRVRGVAAEVARIDALRPRAWQNLRESATVIKEPA